MATTMKVAVLLSLVTGSFAVKAKAVQEIMSAEEPKSPCDAQCRFNIMMCESFMCTKCTYEWCTESCQKIQKDFPGLRCEDWPEARKSYSNGEFMGKGKLGDGGDFAQKKEEEE
eukprot:TRINITY_DN3034_c0_g1_i1.p1 TRINITY_DN3034_c0_g1~~TRINITY_DN3034_c0_g1_i1.p1  ORF type:complete len:114 (+),score=31.14 TRINITY_DN3034_c0_g1_i1:84-425(+)